VELSSASDFWRGAVAAATWLRHPAATNMPENHLVLATRYQSSRWQDAIADTLEACAPQKALALAVKNG
jgi:hypothetical protein